ncbi:hypothetical protein FHS38_003497 [Streptomyces netropsis]|uniref:Uncharacterized protein n=1 Tax=Streptomyces netropsis TaxID=55404 RepID=A0A7W7LD41_STRNE|nr:hypothetical protein [Streptomyces netropsis]GGR10359.1 hypothetical protein GCM10010219_13790 [Streptomyces netropsis]
MPGSGRPLPGNRNDCKARELSGAKAAVGRTTVITDGGYRDTGITAMLGIARLRNLVLTG